MLSVSGYTGKDQTRSEGALVQEATEKVKLDAG